MKQQEGWTVPWIYQADWEEMTLRTEAMWKDLGSSREEVVDLTREIVGLYNELESPLNSLCSKTCPGCEDVCCVKATVWYDQRDIVLYYLVQGSFPEKQISRSREGVCCHLGSDGCRLSRLERPFICTWYLCSEQAASLKSETCDYGSRVTKNIEKIKTLRKKIWAICQETVEP